jgi:DNA polymerase III delta prime subunit
VLRKGPLVHLLHAGYDLFVTVAPMKGIEQYFARPKKLEPPPSSSSSASSASSSSSSGSSSGSQPPKPTAKPNFKAKTKSKPKELKVGGDKKSQAKRTVDADDKDEMVRCGVRSETEPPATKRKANEVEEGAEASDVENIVEIKVDIVDCSVSPLKAVVPSNANAVAIGGGNRSQAKRKIEMANVDVGVHGTEQPTSASVVAALPVAGAVGSPECIVVLDDDEIGKSMDVEASEAIDLAQLEEKAQAMEDEKLRKCANPFFLSREKQARRAYLLKRDKRVAEELKTAEIARSFNSKRKMVASIFETTPVSSSSRACSDTGRVQRSLKWTLPYYPGPAHALPASEGDSSSFACACPERGGLPELPAVPVEPFKRGGYDSLPFPRSLLSRVHARAPGFASILYGPQSSQAIPDDADIMHLVGDEASLALARARGLQEEDALECLRVARRKREAGASHEQWVSVYRPLRGKELCVERSCVAVLQRWLENWKGKMNPGSHSAERGMESGDEDADYCLCENEDEGSSSAFIVCGAQGVGKTAAVYACAAEAGFHIVEVNSAQARNGASIRQMFGEAAQSQRVGCGSSLKGAMSAAAASAPPEVIDLSGLVRRKRGKTDTRHKSSAQKSQNKQKEASADGSRKRTLILVEEIDVVFEEDGGFIAALKELTSVAKVPVVMTSTNLNPGHLKVLTPDHVRFPRPRLAEVCHELSLIAAAEGLHLSVAALSHLAQYHLLDLRACIMTLQGWAPNVSSAILAEDGLNTIESDGGGAELAFDVAMLQLAGRPWLPSAAVQQAIDIIKDGTPIIERLSPAKLSGSGPRCWTPVRIDGRNFAHPSSSLADTAGTKVQAESIMVFFGSQSVPCQLTSDSSIEAFAPPYVKSGCVPVVVVIGTEKGWTIRSKGRMFKYFHPAPSLFPIKGRKNKYVESDSEDDDEIIQTSAKQDAAQESQFVSNDSDSDEAVFEPMPRPGMRIKKKRCVISDDEDEDEGSNMDRTSSVELDEPLVTCSTPTLSGKPPPEPHPSQQSSDPLCAEPPSLTASSLLVTPYSRAPCPPVGGDGLGEPICALLENAWRLCEAFSAADVVSVGCALEPDGDDCASTLQPLDYCRSSFMDMQDVCKERNPWPSYPLRPHVPFCIWSQALNCIPPWQGQRGGGELALGQPKLREDQAHLQSSILSGRSLEFCRQDRADYLINAASHINSSSLRALETPVQLRTTDLCTTTMPYVATMCNAPTSAQMRSDEHVLTRRALQSTHLMLLGTVNDRSMELQFKQAYREKPM